MIGDTGMGRVGIAPKMIHLHSLTARKLDRSIRQVLEDRVMRSGQGKSVSAWQPKMARGSSGADRGGVSLLEKDGVSKRPARNVRTRYKKGSGAVYWKEEMAGDEPTSM